MTGRVHFSSSASARTLPKKRTYKTWRQVTARETRRCQGCQYYIMRGDQTLILNGSQRHPACRPP